MRDLFDPLVYIEMAVNMLVFTWNPKSNGSCFPLRCSFKQRDIRDSDRIVLLEIPIFFFF